MSPTPITNSRAFKVVPADEMRLVLQEKALYSGHPNVREAVSYLADKAWGSAVKVKVLSPGRLKRMQESAIGFANRRGFNVSTLHKLGWLYIQRCDNE